MPILRKAKNYRRYGSPQRMEFRRFGTPVSERNRDRDPDDVSLSRRMFVIRGVAAGSFAVIAGRLGWLQLRPRPAAGSDQPEQQSVRTQMLTSARGLITDRNGEVLAENRKSFALALVRAKLPTTADEKGNIVRDRARLDGMFEAVEQYVPFDWAMTVKPLGPKATPAEIAALAARLEQYSDFDKETLAVLLGRENDDPILLAKDYTREELDAQYKGGTPVRQLFADLVTTKRVDFLRYAEWSVSRYVQPDAARPVLVKRAIPKEVALALDANPLDFPGMVIDDTVLARFYPAGELMAHVLGYVGAVNEREAAQTDPKNPKDTLYAKDDLIGRTGVEAAMEDELRGRRGTRYYRVDALEVDRGTVQAIPAVAGVKLELTLDTGLQKAVRDALAKQMSFAEAEARKTDASHSVVSAVAVVLDPRNGEVLAMVSLPSYDPMLFVEAKNTKAIKALNDEKNLAKPTLNKAIAEAYPPGSTLKPFFAAGGLQEKVIKPTTTFVCTGEIGVPYSTDERTRDPKPCWTQSHGAPPHGPQTVVDAIMNSCDIYFYNLGPASEIDATTGKPVHYYQYLPNRGETRVDFRGLGIDLMGKYLADFGFGDKTGMTDLLGEARGLVPSPDLKIRATKGSKNFPNGEPWSLGDTINVTIGQGDFLCTPLQMAVATAAIANGGNVHRPKLVRRVLGGDGSVLRTADPTPIRRILTQPESLDLVRLGMRKVITDGTAKDKFKTIPVEVAGKTGTAEYGKYIESIVKGQPLKYQHQHAWFTAFAPYKDPEITVAVIIVGGGEGSSFAAPAANDILQYYYGRKKP